MSRFPAVVCLLVIAAAGIFGVWHWVGQPVGMPASPLAANEKLACVSYAPFRRGQTPFDESYSVPESQIREDLAHLRQTVGCVRTYSVNQGLENVPKIAREMGMKMILGLWLGREVEGNAFQIREAVKLAQEYRDVVRLVVVGNEVLLRGEMSADDLTAIIRDVKRKVPVPVTYADVWEYWLKNASLKDAVDVVTIHILPYWEDKPVPADHAGMHIARIRREVELQLGSKPLLIGEAGFPSQGRMRWGARPSPAAQALVLHDLVRIAKENNFDVNYIEAFDQPWKRNLEGIAGGFWGLFDADSREAKFQWGQPVSNHPAWLQGALAGTALALLVFAAALLAARHRPGISAWRWAGVAFIAFIAGTAVGFGYDMAIMSSRTFPEYLRAGILLSVAVIAPVLGSAALIRAEGPAPFAAIMRSEIAASKLSWWLGAITVLTAVMALQTVTGLVFDARYRDFPTALFIGSTVAVLLARSAAAPVNPLAAKPVRHRLSEKVTAGILALGGLTILVIESPLNYPNSNLPDMTANLPNFFANWEALLFVLVVFSLAGTLYAARGVPAPKAAD
jgi:exo-beta-1,3-glucanase (GH17 family)